jgi:hypothetical protein
MRFTLPRRWRRRLTNAIFWVADGLPPGRLAVVDRLQRISRERREQAQHFVQSVTSKPYSLKYVGFTLIELFPDEVRREVEDSVQVLFPAMERERDHDTSVLWWHKFGRIYRARPEGFFIPPDSVKYIPTLPTWIDYIEVRIVQEYSSTFMLVADVVTNEQVDELLRQRMQMEAPGVVELHQMRRLRQLGFAYSRHPSGTAYADNFVRALAALRDTVQRVVFDAIRPRGYFLTHESTLPAIELIEVAGNQLNVPEDQWVASTSGWLHALGLRVDSDYYAGGNVIVSFARDFDSRYPPVWRVVFRPDYEPQTVGTPDRSRGGVVRELDDQLGATLQSLATTAHHEVLASLLRRFRRRVYLSGRRRSDIPGQVKLYEDILSERTFFRRARHDFEDRHIYPEPNDFLHAMHYRTLFRPWANDTRPADEHLRDRLRWMYERLAEGIEDIHGPYSDVLSARTWRATNRLSRTAIIISTTSVVVAVIVGLLRVTGNATPQWQWPHWQAWFAASSSTSSPARIPTPRPKPKHTPRPKVMP